MHRIDHNDQIAQWPVGDEPDGLSVSISSNVLVTCRSAGKCKEFTTDGTLLREISFQSDIVSPSHVVELTTDQFVVSYGLYCDKSPGVCVVNGNGRIIQSFNEAVAPSGYKARFSWLLPSWARSAGARNIPRRLIVKGLIFVSDVNSDRIYLLNSSLKFVRQIVCGQRKPLRICFDEQESRLYVADCEWANNAWVAGKVDVYSITE